MITRSSKNASVLSRVQQDGNADVSAGQSAVKAAEMSLMVDSIMPEDGVRWTLIPFSETHSRAFRD